MVGMKAMREEMGRIDRRVSALDLREELLIEKTRTAAATAASAAVTTHLVDMSRRIGALEAGQDNRRRLAEPEKTIAMPSVPTQYRLNARLHA